MRSISTLLLTTMVAIIMGNAMAKYLLVDLNGDEEGICFVTSLIKIYESESYFKLYKMTPSSTL